MPFSQGEQKAFEAVTNPASVLGTSREQNNREHLFFTVTIEFADILLFLLLLEDVEKSVQYAGLSTYCHCLLMFA